MMFTEETDEVKKAQRIEVAGFTAFLNGHDAEAERLYSQFIAEMNDLGYRGPLLANAHGHLAFICFVHDRPVEAELHFLEAYEVYESLSFADGVSASVMLGHFGEFYRRQRRYEEAEALFRRSVALCERDMGEDNWLLPGSSLNFYGELLKDVGRDEEAEGMRESVRRIEENKGAKGD